VYSSQRFGRCFYAHSPIESEVRHVSNYHHMFFQSGPEYRLARAD
jgi:hypothetical protein